MQKKWFWHLLFWSFYLALEVYTEFYWMRIQYQQPIWSAFANAFAEEFILILVVKIPMIYFMLFCIKRFGHQNKNRLKLMSGLLFSLLFFTAAGYFLLLDFTIPVIYSHMKIVESGGLGTFINSFMDKIFVACVAIALMEYDHAEQLKKREQILLSERSQTELLFLKSQINPHFLFNTLNNIYALSLKKSDETPKVVLKLSKMLRYILYETDVSFINIAKEIEFLEHYLSLQKIRFDERLIVNFHREIDDENEQIVPLLLIPLLENAFKHGASQSSQNSFINMDLKLKNGMFNFKIENSFETSRQENKSGIGLRNLKRQLELSYDDPLFKTEVSNYVFRAELTIDLNKKL